LHQVKKAPQSGRTRHHELWIERTPDDLKKLSTHRHPRHQRFRNPQLSNEHNLLRAARRIFKRPSALSSSGEYGALLVDKNGVFCVPAFPLEEPHDPTGAVTPRWRL